MKKFVFMNERTRRQYIRAQVDKWVDKGVDVRDAWDRIMTREEEAYKKLKRQAAH